MKLTTFLMILGCMQLHAAVFSQTINLSERNASLETVFSKLEKQSGYTFFSRLEIIRAMPKVNVTLKNATLEEALDQLLGKLSLTYSIVDKTVVVNLKPQLKAGFNILQPRVYAGKVLDEKGMPMPGVSIKIKGTNLVTVSNNAGQFLTPVISDIKAVLQISYIGYVTQEIPVSELKLPIVIRLKVANSDLDQVQILAYGTTTKRLSTGNTFTIKSEEIRKNPVPNILQVLENRVPGLQIGQTTGQVGGSFNVKIRGLNGLNNVDPLYIVDGVPYPAGGTNFNPNGQSGGLPTLSNNRGSGTLAQQGGNALNYINPEDIESIDVLKDADATAIYGSRGAYGVILITTKKGSRNKNGEPSLSVNANRSLMVTGAFPELLKTDDYLMLRREALKNDGLQVSAADLDLNGTYSPDAYTNWAKELTNYRASTTRLNARYSGGTELSNYSISGSYNDQGNVLRSSGYNRDGGLKMDLNMLNKNKKLNLLTSILFNSTVNTMNPYDFTGDASTLRAPNAPSYFNPDGSLNWSTNTNPFGYLNVNYKGVTNNLLGSTNLVYNPIKGLTLKAVLGYNLLTGNELRQTPTTVFAPTDANATTNANSNSNYYNIRTWSFEPYANYVTKLGKQGTITGILGATFQDKLLYQDQINGRGYVADARLNNPAAGSTVTASYTKSFTRYMGYFGGLNYNWANKYILNLNARYDGSTKFGPSQRFGWFGSIGGAYIFSQEQFIKDNLPFLSFGKLRGSYGTTGGDGIENFLYTGTYSTGASYLGNTVFTNNSLSNRDLHWETNKKQDYGVSLGFLSDRILLDASHYKNVVSDQLIGEPLTSVTGFTGVTKNSHAVIQNTGWEFALNTVNIKSENFGWSTNVVMTAPKSKVIYLPESYTSPNVNFILGQPITNVKLYNYAGVNRETGEYNFTNAAGVTGPFVFGLTSDDKTANVDVSQRYYGSISNSLNYKNLSFDFTIAIVNKMGLNYQGQLDFLPGYFDKNTTKWALDRWQQPGDVTNVPKATTNLLNSYLGQINFRQSSGAYERITYARLQNASLSYSLPKELLKRVKVSNLRIMLQGQNLFTISKYKDLDPENMSINSLPPLRVFNLGLNLTL